ARRGPGRGARDPRGADRARRPLRAHRRATAARGGALGPRRPGVRAREARIAPPEEAPSRDVETDLSLLKKLLPYARPPALLFLGALVMMPIASGATLFQPLLKKRALDSALGATTEPLLSVVGLYLLAIGIEFVVRFAQIY